MHYLLPCVNRIEHLGSGLVFSEFTNLLIGSGCCFYDMETKANIQSNYEIMKTEMDSNK